MKKTNRLVAIIEIVIEIAFWFMVVMAPLYAIATIIDIYTDSDVNNSSSLQVYEIATKAGFDGVIQGDSGMPRVAGNGVEPIMVMVVEEEVIEEIIEEDVEKEAEPEVAYFDVPLSHDLQDHIFAECAKHDIDPAIIIAMIERESDYRPSLMGDSGASYGLMQVQPRWHQGRMDKLGVTDLLDPYQNVTVGIDYLAELLGRGKGIEWALMGYNGGPSYANRKVSEGIVSNYARGVLEMADSLA